MHALRSFFAASRLRIVIAVLAVITVGITAFFLSMRDTNDSSSPSAPAGSNGPVTVIYDADGNIVSVGNVPQVDPAAALRALNIPQTCDEGLARLDEIIAGGKTALTADPDTVYEFNIIHRVSTELCSFRHFQDWSETNMGNWTQEGTDSTTQADIDPGEPGTLPPEGDGGTVIDVSGDDRPLPVVPDTGQTPATVTGDPTPPTLTTDSTSD